MDQRLKIKALLQDTFERFGCQVEFENKQGWMKILHEEVRRVSYFVGWNELKDQHFITVHGFLGHKRYRQRKGSPPEFWGEFTIRVIGEISKEIGRHLTFDRTREIDQ